MGPFGDINLVGVLAHIFFIGSGVALGVRVADDLLHWRERRSARTAQREQG